MKDCKYILSKLIKKHLVPLLLLVMGMVLFFVNILNRPIAYASEIIAKVECGVFVVDGDNVQNLSNDYILISTIDETIIDFSDIDVKLNSQSRIEINYLVENISNDNQGLNLDLEKLTMKNFKVEYVLGEADLREFSMINHMLNLGEIVNVKIVISIDDVTKDALLDGYLKLTINSVGENG